MADANLDDDDDDDGYNNAGEFLKSYPTVKQIDLPRLWLGKSQHQALITIASLFAHFRKKEDSGGVDRPPSGAEILVFLERVVRTKYPSDEERETPVSLSHFELYEKMVQIYCQLTFGRDFCVGANYTQDLDTLSKRFVSKGRLVSGSKKDTSLVTHIDVKILDHLFRCYLHFALTLGVWNWDIVLYDLMCMSLLAASGQSSGTIAMSSNAIEAGKEGSPNREISDQCLVYSDIKIRLVKRTNPTVENLAALVCFRLTPSNRNKANQSHDRSFYGNPTQPLLCFIQLVINHAIRQGIAPAMTMEGVLEKAASHPEGRVEWQQPNYPLFCAKDQSSGRVLLLATPASTHQPLSTIQKLFQIAEIYKDEADKAGLGTRINTRAFRNGLIDQISRFPDSYRAGEVTMVTANVANHDNKQLNGGLMRMYSGDMDSDFYGLCIVMAQKYPHVNKMIRFAEGHNGALLSCNNDYTLRLPGGITNKRKGNELMQGVSKKRKDNEVSDTTANAAPNATPNDGSFGHDEESRDILSQLFRLPMKSLNLAAMEKLDVVCGLSSPTEWSKFITTQNTVHKSEVARAVATGQRALATALKKHGNAAKPRNKPAPFYFLCECGFETPHFQKFQQHVADCDGSKPKSASSSSPPDMPLTEEQKQGQCPFNCGKHLSKKEFDEHVLEHLTLLVECGLCTKPKELKVASNTSYQSHMRKNHKDDSRLKAERLRIKTLRNQALLPYKRAANEGYCSNCYTPLSVGSVLKKHVDCVHDGVGDNCQFVLF